MQQQVRSGSQPVRLLHTTFLDLGLLPSFHSLTRGHEGSLRSGDIGSLSVQLRLILQLPAIHWITQSTLRHRPLVVGIFSQYMYPCRAREAGLRRTRMQTTALPHQRKTTVGKVRKSPPHHAMAIQKIRIKRPQLPNPRSSRPRHIRECICMQ
jgi:hypothetical protein